MFTENNDIVTLQGSLQHLTLSLTNSYTGLTIDIDEEKFVSEGVYDGLGGTDRIDGTIYGDAIFLDTSKMQSENTIMQQTIFNIERIEAKNQGDIIDLSSSNYDYGDITILGGTGDDILWANKGNDRIAGSHGNDIIDGGPGADQLRGGNDNDQLYGGDGNDDIRGGTGDDILYGGTSLGLMELDKDFLDNITFPDLVEGTDISNLIPPGTPALGISADNLTVEYDATATVTFKDGFAGYNNTLGIYNIAEDGTIQMAQVLWENVKTAGINIEHTIELPVGEAGGQFGFFIIADGDRKNDGYDGMDDILEQSAIEFIYDYGGVNQRAATIEDDGSMISLVYEDGTVLDGYTYHTTPRGENTELNWDGEIHAVSGLLDLSNQDILRIGFEDLPNLGDADFEDVLFDLNINRIHIESDEQGSDYLDGNEGDDILYAEAGDDYLVIGDGFDIAHTGSGADTILLREIDAFTDKIMDFDIDAGDRLLLGSVLQEYDPLDDNIVDFLQLTQDGDDTTLLVNQNNATSTEFVEAITFVGGVDATLTELINNGIFNLDYPTESWQA